LINPALLQKQMAKAMGKTPTRIVQSPEEVPSIKQEDQQPEKPPKKLIEKVQKTQIKKELFSPDSKLAKSGWCIGCTGYSTQAPKTNVWIEWCTRPTELEEKYEWVYKRIRDNVTIGQCPRYEKQRMLHERG